MNKESKADKLQKITDKHRIVELVMKTEDIAETIEILEALYSECIRKNRKGGLIHFSSVYEQTLSAGNGKVKIQRLSCMLGAKTLPKENLKWAFIDDEIIDNQVLDFENDMIDNGFWE